MKTVTSPNLAAGEQVYSVVLHLPQRYARGGLVRAANAVRGAGRYGDDVLVHMNKAEFEQIKKAWGQPTYNPQTGLPEYFSLGSLVPAIASIGLGLLGSAHSGGNSGVNPAPPMDPNMTARLPQWTNQRTVIPHTSPSSYFTYGQASNANPGEWNFFGNNSLSAIGPPPAPPASAPQQGQQLRPFMGGVLGRGRRTGFATGGPVGPPQIGQAPPGFLGPRPLPPSLAGMHPGGLPPVQASQFGVPPPGGGLPPPGAIGAPPMPSSPGGSPAVGGGPGGAGSMIGSPVALQRPQGPAGAPPLGGLGQGYARAPIGMPRPGARAFADGGPALGPGTGRSDDIHAKLSDGEYVMDAETVSLLGDGSTNAGANKLDAMRKAIRSHKGAALAKGKFSPKAKMPLDYLNDMKARDDMNRNLRKGIK